MNTSSFLPCFLSLLLFPATRVVAADELLYFPATLENTTLSDGTALKVVAKAPAAPEEITRSTTEAEPNNHWHWREGAGSGAGSKRGVFAAAGTKGNNAPMLQTLLAGLEPNANYRVHGFFWIAGTCSAQVAPLGDRLWDIRFGISMASMRGFGYACQAGLPDTIGMDMSPPLVFRQMDAPMHTPAGEPKVDHEEDRCLFRALLGVARTDAKGTLVVSIDDQAHDTNQGRTWYDGIGVIPAPDATAEVGANAPGSLTLAVRSGDWEMMRRELAVGADPNALDADSLTPLYYASVAGAHEQVAALLKAGAKPDVSEQKYNPLSAAAIAGDVKLTQMLLDAGARISSEESHLMPYPQLRSNPVEEAVRSGSVAVLKLFLARDPDLDLERAVYGPAFDSKDPSVFTRTSNGLVKGSIETNCPEMAAFLIDKGYQIEFDEDNEVPSGRVKNSGSHTLMLAALMIDPPMLGVIAALEKRGVPVIMDKKVDYESVVVPWDALSGAVWEGHAGLVRKWLPKAATVNEDYRIRLTVLAESCGKPAVLEMVRQQFPKVKWQPFAYPYDQLDRSRERISGPKDLFQPRTLPPEKRKTANSNKVLAIISSPKAGGPAAALAAKASEQALWTVVEREELDKLLTEKSLKDPSGAGTAELSAIGDRFSADIFIIVSWFGEGDTALLTFEAVNVRTGLPFDRLIFAAKEFAPDKFSADYLARVRRKFDAQSGTAAPIGITLLDISADPKLTHGQTLANLLHAGLLQEIDGIPGLIALTREQMAPLAAEKVLKQSGGLWGAAWTLEGGLSPGEGDQVVLAVRLRSLGRDATSHDVKATGSPEHPQAMVQEVWRKLAILIGKGDAAVKATAPEQRAATEAARLLREAEWLANSPKFWEAIPIVDAALYLGADPMKALPLRLRIHWASRHFWNPRTQFGSIFDFQKARGYPLRPEFHDYAQHWVTEHLELLRLTSDTLDGLLQVLKEQPDKIRNDSANVFWYYLDCLVIYRSQLVPARLDPEKLATLKEFDAELETLYKRLLPLEKSPTKLGKLLWWSEHTTGHFRSLPWLGKLIAGEIIRTWPAEQDLYLGALFSYSTFPRFDPVRTVVIADLLEQAMMGKALRFEELRKAELAVLRASGQARSDAARTLAHARIQAMAASNVPPSLWVSLDQFQKIFPLLAIDNFQPTMGDSFLSSLVSSPQQVPDMLFRLENYSLHRHMLAMVCDKNSPQWQKRDAMTNGYFDNELNKLEARNAPAKDYDRLSEHAALLDRTYRTGYAARIQPRIAKSRPQSSGRTFGSKGQFPILNFEGTVDTKLLVDVRDGVTDKPAMIARSMIDPKNRHILWLILQPYHEWDFKLLEPPLENGITPPFAASQPWLLAIDCRDGHVVHKINLAAIPGLRSYNAPETMPLSLFEGAVTSELIANDTHLLVEIRWGHLPDTPGSPAPDITSLVSIDRETGESQVLPQKLRMVSGAMLSGDANPGATGIGNSFFVIQSTESDGKMLWQIKPGTAPKLLVKPGRRPEESPFDAADQKIDLLRADNGRLLAASSWDHFAYYNPALGKWEDAPVRNASEWKEYVQGMDRDHFQATLFPHHLYKHEDGIDVAFAGPTATQPGRLPFESRSGPSGNLPVRMQIPDTYRARFQVDCKNGLQLSAREGAEFEWINIADMACSNMVTPALLNQTDNCFVLASRVAATPGSMHYFPNNPPYLPFLWIMDKTAARAAIKRAQAK